ncbi:hypothetical protein C0J52_22311 [Blattella germanica]|nr:hypothetical protein C0J52_22311 [Blattella germanica]
MEFTAEHRTFVVNSYLRTVRFIGGLPRYNVRVCVDEFLLAYPQFQQISREKLCESFTGALPSFGRAARRTENILKRENLRTNLNGINLK